MRYPILLIASCILLSGQASASDKLYMNSFITIGASAHDNDGTYYDTMTRHPDVDGSDTKIGLNLFGQLSDELSAVTQFTSRAEDDYSLVTDWAFLSYKPHTELEFKAGRQKFPLWLMSDYIDVGRAYPWVRPPEEVYNLFFFKSMSGFNVAWNSDERFEDFNLSLELYTGRITDKSTFQGTEITINSPRLYGATLSATWDELKIRLANINITYDVPEFGSLNSGSSLTTFGLEYDDGDFLVLAELASPEDLTTQEVKDQRLENAQSAIATAQANNDAEALVVAQRLLFSAQGDAFGGGAGYMTLGYHFDDLLTHYTFSRVYSEGATIVENQSSHTLGLQYAFNPKADVKFEVKHIMLPDTAGENGLYSVATGADDVKRESNLYSMAFNVNF